MSESLALPSALVIAPLPQRSTAQPSLQPQLIHPLVTNPGLSVCPNCQGQVVPGEDICEQCGMVLGAPLIPSQSLQTSATPLQGTDAALASGTISATCPHCQKPCKPGTKICNHCGYRFPNDTTQTPVAASVSSSVAVPQPQTDPLSSQPLQRGTLLNGKYSVLKEIGAGGMGAVYLAEDIILKRRVVIKALLSDDDPDLVAQNVKEREFLAAMKHASIVSIYDFIVVGSNGALRFLFRRRLSISRESFPPFRIWQSSALFTATLSRKMLWLKS